MPNKDNEIVFPATMEFVKECLDEMEMKYSLKERLDNVLFTEDQNAILMEIGNNLFALTALSTRADYYRWETLWRRGLSLQWRDRLLELCNEWNTKETFPPVYVAEYGGALTVHCSYTVLKGKGITRAQLTDSILKFIETANNCFKFLDRGVGYPGAR